MITLKFRMEGQTNLLAGYEAQVCNFLASMSTQELITVWYNFRELLELFGCDYYDVCHMEYSPYLLILFGIMNFTCCVSFLLLYTRTDRNMSISNVMWISYLFTITTSCGTWFLQPIILWVNGYNFNLWIWLFKCTPPGCQYAALWFKNLRPITYWFIAQALWSGWVNTPAYCFYWVCQCLDKIDNEAPRKKANKKRGLDLDFDDSVVIIVL